MLTRISSTALQIKTGKKLFKLNDNPLRIILVGVFCFLNSIEAKSLKLNPFDRT